MLAAQARHLQFYKSIATLPTILTLLANKPNAEPFSSVGWRVFIPTVLAVLPTVLWLVWA